MLLIGVTEHTDYRILRKVGQNIIGATSDNHTRLSRSNPTDHTALSQKQTVCARLTVFDCHIIVLENLYCKLLRRKALLVCLDKNLRKTAIARRQCDQFAVVAFYSEPFCKSVAKLAATAPILARVIVMTSA